MASDDKVIEAIAEAWASIDGHLDAFKAENHGRLSTDDPKFTGHYLGYISEAKELLARIRTRGFDVCARKGDG